MIIERIWQFWRSMKKTSDPFVLFLVTTAMFFYRSKIPTSVLCRISQRTFTPNLVQIGQVMSEEKIFERQ